MVELSVAEARLLLALPADGKPVDAAALATSMGAAEVEVLQAAGVPQRLGLVAVAEQSQTLHALSAEGRAHQAAGLPERRAVQALHAAGGHLPMGQLASAAKLAGNEVPVAIGWLKRKGWAQLVKGASGQELVAEGPVPPMGSDEVALQELAGTGQAGSMNGLSTLLSRGGLVVETVRTSRSLHLTPAGMAHLATLDRQALESAVEVNQITPDLVAKWSTLTPAQRAGVRIRPFDTGLAVTPQFPGKAHPLTQMIEEIRDIFVGLGFQEIEGDYVESCFWNMDALFIPQDHPAREMQDTFYLDEPKSLPLPDKLWETVKDVQTTGGKTGSTGWGGQFTKPESARSLLRTHTTVTTIRHLAANPGGPQRIFGVGRVFRNEAMDATHLPEFHQVEGIVVEEGATFATLMGLLREFYTRLGFPEVKFRPSYYPYTEPSLDVAVKWGDRWLELGGAGIFRPEVTQPLGVKHNVLAWGLGLERLAMLRLGLKDIRQLYVSDVQWLRENPLR